MDFTAAVTCLQAGLLVARKGWNGKGMWLCYVSHWAFQVPPTVQIPPDYHIKPFIMMKTADNGLVPWLCSQTDMLADDWELVDRTYRPNAASDLRPGTPCDPLVTDFEPAGSGPAAPVPHFTFNPEGSGPAEAQPIRTVRSNAK